MSPIYKMPDEGTRRRGAVRAEIDDALGAARCAAELAGLGTREFVVRELVVTVVQQIDRAAAGVRRLCSP